MKFPTKILAVFLLIIVFAFPVWAEEEPSFDEQKAEKALEQATSEIAKTTTQTEKKLSEDANHIMKETEEAAPAPTIWDLFPPDVQVFMWGEQFRIKVTAHPDTPKENLAGIQSIKLEKMDGTFLGYRPFNAEEPRQAIFMTDPSKIQIDSAVVTIASTADPELKKVISLEHPADNEIAITAPAPASPAAEKVAETKDKGGEKKKKWFW